MPYCSSRPVYSVRLRVTLPKVAGVLKSTPGLSQLMWLKALYASSRASNLKRSVILNDLLIAMSVCQILGPTSPGKVHGFVRGVSGLVVGGTGTCWNLVMSNHCLLVPFAGVSTFGLPATNKLWLNCSMRPEYKRVD